MGAQLPRCPGFQDCWLPLQAPKPRYLSPGIWMPWNKMTKLLPLNDDFLRLQTWTVCGSQVLGSRFRFAISIGRMEIASLNLPSLWQLASPTKPASKQEIKQTSWQTDKPTYSISQCLSLHVFIICICYWHVPMCRYKFQDHGSGLQSPFCIQQSRQNGDCKPEPFVGHKF